MKDTTAFLLIGAVSTAAYLLLYALFRAVLPSSISGDVAALGSALSPGTSPLDVGRLVAGAGRALLSQTA